MALAALVAIGLFALSDSAHPARGQEEPAPAAPAPAPPDDNQAAPEDAPNAGLPAARPAFGPGESPLIHRLRAASPEAVMDLETSWKVDEGDLVNLRERIAIEGRLQWMAITSWERTAPGRLVDASRGRLVFEAIDGYETWQLDVGRNDDDRLAFDGIGMSVVQPTITSVSGHRIVAIRATPDGRTTTLWDYRTPAPIVKATVAPGLVLARTSANRVWVLHGATGRVLGRLDLDDTGGEVVPLRGGLLVVDRTRVRHVDLIRLEGLQLLRAGNRGAGDSTPGIDAHDMVLQLIHEDSSMRRRALIDRMVRWPGNRLDVFLDDALAARVFRHDFDDETLALIRQLSDVLEQRGHDLGIRYIRQQLRDTLSRIGLPRINEQPFDINTVSLGLLDRISALGGLLADWHNPADSPLFLTLLQAPMDRYYHMPFQDLALRYITGMPREAARPVFARLLLDRAQTAPFKPFSIDQLQAMLDGQRTGTLPTFAASRIWTSDDVEACNNMLAEVARLRDDLSTVQRRAALGPTSAARLEIAMTIAVVQLDRVRRVVSQLGSALCVLQASRDALQAHTRLDGPVRQVLDEAWARLYGDMLGAVERIRELDESEARVHLDAAVELRQRIERLDIRSVVDALH